MPSCIPKKTRFAPGTKTYGPDEVLDVPYLQELLRAVGYGIQDEKKRVRELSDQNSMLQKRIDAMRKEEKILVEKLKDLQREARKQKLRTDRLRYKYESARPCRTMGQTSDGFQPVQENHWTPYKSYVGNETFNQMSYCPANSYSADPRVFVSHFPPHTPIFPEPIYHQFHSPPALHPAPCQLTSPTINFFDCEIEHMGVAKPSTLLVIDRSAIIRLCMEISCASCHYRI